MADLIRFALFVLLVSSSIGCGTTMQQRKFKSELSAQKPKVHLVNTPFVAQKKNHCGPATLAMVAQKYDPSLGLETVTRMTFSPGAEGTFKGDMLSASRRLGFAAYEVSSSREMFSSLVEGHPVIVFQDNGLAWAKVWHYAVLLGYDAHTESVFLHTGGDPYERVSLSSFVKSWEKGGQWSYVTVPVQTIPTFADLKEAMANAMVLGQLKKHQVAIRLYQAMIDRWPNRFEPAAGLANEYAAINKKHNAIEALRSAVRKNPIHPGLYFNLSHIYHQVGDHEMAKKMKAKTLQVATKDQIEFYKQKLNAIR